MPNNPPRHKRKNPLSHRTAKRPSRAGDSVKTLLDNPRFKALARINEQAAQQQHWHAWLRAHLPEELAAHVSGVAVRDTTLVIFTESAAWCARVRYALAELTLPLKTSVRILPRQRGST
jgi:hypothetical protein